MLKYEHYVFELGAIIKERAMEAKADHEKSYSGTKAGEFESGRLLAFNEVVSIMQQQAESFDIPLEKLHLQGIDPDRDLL